MNISVEKQFRNEKTLIRVLTDYDVGWVFSNSNYSMWLLNPPESYENVAETTLGRTSDA